MKGVYVGAEFVAAGTVAACQCPNYLKTYLKKVYPDFPGVRSMYVRLVVWNTLRYVLRSICMLLALMTVMPLITFPSRVGDESKKMLEWSLVASNSADCYKAVEVSYTHNEDHPTLICHMALPSTSTPRKLPPGIEGLQSA